MPALVQAVVNRLTGKYSESFRPVKSRDKARGPREVAVTVRWPELSTPPRLRGSRVRPHPDSNLALAASLGKTTERTVRLVSAPRPARFPARARHRRRGKRGHAP